jgi:phosphoglycolate phosphatase
MTTDERKKDLKFQAVIFDLDGTLVDHFTAIHKVFSVVLARVGAPARSFEEVKRAVGGSHETTLRKFVTEAQFEEALKIYRELIQGEMALEGVFLLDGARETLEQLEQRGVKMAVLTNKWGKVTRRLLQHLEAAHFFGAIVGVEDTRWRKPERELTDYTMKQLGVMAAQTLMVGDSPFDVATARNAGLKVCLVPTGTHTAEELAAERPDWLVSSLRDVVGVVDGR